MPRQDPEPNAHGDDAGRTSLERVNSLVQTLAIVGAGAWGVYTFVYEARIKPSLEPPSVSVKTDLVKAGERDDHVAIRSTVTRTNVGQTSVRVLGLSYNVVGLNARFSTGAGSERPKDLPEREAAFEASLTRSASVGIAKDYEQGGEGGEVILREGVLFAGATELAAEPSDLNPGETVSRDVVVYADRSRFDSVRFEVSLAYEKETDAPVRLRFENRPHSKLSLVPAAPCTGDPCPLKVTEFATEFSLW